MGHDLECEYSQDGQRTDADTNEQYSFIRNNDGTNLYISQLIHHQTHNSQCVFQTNVYCNQALLDLERTNTKS